MNKSIERLGPVGTLVVLPRFTLGGERGAAPPELTRPELELTQWPLAGRIQKSSADLNEPVKVLVKQQHNQSILKMNEN